MIAAVYMHTCLSVALQTVHKPRHLPPVPTYTLHKECVLVRAVQSSLGWPWYCGSTTMLHNRCSELRPVEQHLC